MAASSRPDLPPTKGKKASPEALHTFMEYVFKPDMPYRIGIRRLLNRARLYRMGTQWLEPVLDDGFMSADWSILQQDDLNGIPMPVQNETFPIVTREAALIVKVGENPYIRPSRNDPKSQKKAKFAKDVLRSSLDEIGIHDLEREGSMHMVTYGTWWQASYMDYDYTKTTRVGVEGALKCPNPDCDMRFASAELNEEEGEALSRQAPGAVTISTGPDPNNQFLDADLQYKATRCPRCTEHKAFGMRGAYAPDGLPRLDTAGNQAQEFGEMMAPGPPALVPHEPTEEEATVGKDFLGRPMGEDLPIGQATIENISPFDANPNPGSQGLDCNARNWEEFAWAVPRSLDWIRARYPENGWKVKAEWGSEIYRYHPVLGGLGSGGITIGGPEMFQNHALVRTFVKRPYMEKEKDEAGVETGKVKRNRGRLVVMSNRVVLEDGDLEVERKEKPGTFIARMHFDWAQWEQRDREAHGLGVPELIFSQQDTVNTNKSQQMDARHRMANPKWMAPDGTSFSYKGGASSNYTSDFLLYRNADKKEKQGPTPFPGITIPSGVFQEFQLDLDAMPRIALAAEVEQGDPPGGVTAYSALLLLAQKAADSRKPRNERIRDMKSRLYRHHLELIQEFYREPRLYRMRGNNDKWSVYEFLGADLQGEVDVQFDIEPVIDVGVSKREGIKMGLDLGTIVADSIPAKARINQALEISNEINQDSNLQVARAQDEFIAWTLKDRPPLIREMTGTDNHPIHWQVHSEDLQGEEWETRKEVCNWMRVEVALAGWRKDFDSLLAMEQALELQPPVPPDPQIATLAVPGGGPEGYQAALQAYQNSVQILQKIAAMPKLMELRILTVWQQQLMPLGIIPAPDDLSEEADAFRKVIRAEAHAQAHKVLLERETNQVNMGATIAAAPGATQTAQGVVPSAGEAAAPPAAGGAGMGAVPTPPPS